MGILSNYSHSDAVNAALSKGTEAHGEIVAAKTDVEGIEHVSLKNRLDVFDNSIRSTDTLKNLLNGTTFTSGNYIRENDGTLVESESYLATDYIDITGITELLVTRGVAQFAYYDASKTYVSGVLITTTEHANEVYVIPEGVAYARFSISQYYFNNVEVGVYNRTNYNSGLGVLSGKINRIASPENIMDADSLLDGYYVSSSDGAFRANASFMVTRFINISNISKLLVTNGVAQFAYYDASKTFLSGVTISSTIHVDKVYDVPEGAVYARFSVSKLIVSESNGVRIGVYDFDKLNECNEQTRKRIVVGNGGFARLRDGIEEAIKYRGSTVIVYPGIYDLLTEFETELAAAPLTEQIGIKLENDVHVIFEAGAKVTALYQGEDTTITTYFSPFYSGANGGYILENAVIESAATRYCVHDENGKDSGSRRKGFIRCQMIHDDSTAPTKGFPQCIGGGFGQHEDITIDGCYFKTKRSETDNVQASLVSYHNTGHFSDALSTVHVKDSYFDDLGNIRFTHYGSSTGVSPAYVCGCSFGHAPIVRHETTNTSTPVNTKLISWNNEVRSST